MIIGEWDIRDKDDFAVWVKSRIINGINCHETYEIFGKRHKVGKTAVANWVKGDRTPSLERIIRILDKEGFKLVIKEK